uniref:Uncharacterized protein n=1 Tax=viral metagenome TaxID=1070528 RepID=A0A6M3JPY8_9ZZZZ
MIPTHDLKEAGLGWLNDPKESIQATEIDWQNYLQYLIFRHEQLEQLLVQCVNSDDDKGAKKVGSVMIRLNDRMTGVESVLSSFRAQHR